MRRQTIRVKAGKKRMRQQFQTAAKMQNGEKIWIKKRY